MCLAIPGVITAVEGDDPLMRKGNVDFGGVSRDINLVYCPEAEIGSWVLVHAGVAISTIDEEEAQEVLKELEALKNVGGGMFGAEE